MTEKIKSNPEKLIKKHESLIHSDMLKVLSHVQRKDGDWIINTVMVEGCSAPFKFRRKKGYKNLKGACVNMTYYADVELVAGFDLEIMTVVRVKVS